jgi:DNA-binding IclR family transcriptional regulator
VAEETSQTLERGLRLLRLLAAGSSRGATVSELAAGLESSRPAVYRLVATLSRYGMVHRDRDGKIRLGLGVLQLARAVHPLLRETAVPLLRELAEDVGATAHLTIADGDEALAVAVVEPSWTDVHVAYRVGSRHPLDRGAAGIAILRARGSNRVGRGPYVMTEGELQPGARGVAAPVLGVPEVEASVGVVALGGLDAAVAGPRVVKAAAALAAALG